MPSLTHQQIVEIRDRHLPSQGESFNWSAFVDAVVTAHLESAAPKFERLRVLREAHCIARSRAFFEARPGFDRDEPRRLFQHGFERGFNAGVEMLLDALTRSNPNTTEVAGNSVERPS